MTLFTERLNGFRPMDTHRRKIALVAALEREVWPLVKHWSASEREFDGRQFRFFENARAVLVCGGIGAEAARRATEAISASTNLSPLRASGSRARWTRG